MRRTVKLLSLAVGAAALATPAIAAPYAGSPDSPSNYGAPIYAAPAAGLAVGTVVGVGTYEAWWGSGAFAASLPTTAAGAAAVGGVAGVGTVALVDAAVQPCRGFAMVFGVNRGACVNGQYVGYGPREARYVHGRRVVR